jgi:hypothetical protein
MMTEAGKEYLRLLCKRRKSSKQTREGRETLLISKLQARSLKVHGDPLDPPKKAPAKKKGK